MSSDLLLFLPGLLDQGMALEEGSWRGVVEPSEDKDMHDSMMAWQTTYNFYFDLILFSSLVAVGSAACGVALCLFCKSMPQTDMQADTKCFAPTFYCCGKRLGQLNCQFLEEGCKTVCCPDPVMELTEEEKDRQARQESVKKMLVDVDNTQDMQVGGNMESFRVSSVELTSRLSSKNLMDR